MGSKYCTVEVLEIETGDGIIVGKGRHKRDLVYFMLDATYLRQPEQVCEGGRITVTQDEIHGVARGFFARKG